MLIASDLPCNYDHPAKAAFLRNDLQSQAVVWHRCSFSGGTAWHVPHGGAKTVFSMPQLVHVSDEDEAEAFSETVWTCVGFAQINHLFVRFAGRGDYGAIRLARK